MIRLSKLLASAATAFTLMATALSAQAVAVANQTYLFFGTCLDCTLNSPPGAPLATLVLSGAYTPGDEIVVEDFVSFSYVGSDLVFAYTVMPSADDGIKGLDFISGSMVAAAGPRDFAIGFGGDGQRFESLSSGSWFTCSNGPDGYYSGTCSLQVNDDFGRDGSWNQPTGTPLPEPASLALVALGLAVSMRRRKTR